MAGWSKAERTRMQSMYGEQGASNPYYVRGQEGGSGMAEKDAVDDPGQVCIVPNCGKKGSWKQLCPSCYGVAKKLIDKGETSWEELAEMGLAKIEEKPMIAAFRKKKEEMKKAKAAEEKRKSEWMEDQTAE